MSSFRPDPKTGTIGQRAGSEPQAGRGADIHPGLVTGDAWGATGPIEGWGFVAYRFFGGSGYREISW